LRADGELDTRQLAERVMCERNLDATDTALPQFSRFQGRSSLAARCTSSELDLPLRPPRHTGR